MAFVSATTATVIANWTTGFVMILSADPTARRREVAVIAMVRRTAGLTERDVATVISCMATISRSRSPRR
jgi:hypothetical protein